MRRAAVCVMAVCGAVAAQAQSNEPFYKGRTITMTIAAAPGGVNDLASRLLAQYLGKYIPGHPAIVPQNIPGGAGVVGANRMYNAAEKDGTVIAILDRGVPQLAILGDPNAKYDPVRFTWLGSISSYANDAYIMAVNATHPAKTVDDLTKSGVSITLGGMNPGTTNLTFATIAKEVLGLNVKVVRGYTGAAPMFLAMQTAELDGQVVGLSSLKAGQPAMWAEQRVRALVQFGRATRLPELAGIPTGRELARDADARAMLEFAELPFFSALPYVAPPGIPADRARDLQNAFMETVKDSGFIEGAHRLSLELSPIDGEAVRALIVRAAATPVEVREHYRKIDGN